MLQDRVEQFGSQTAWAKKIGLTRQAISKVLRGAKPGRAVLADLKLQEGECYHPVRRRSG